MAAALAALSSLALAGAAGVATTARTASEPLTPRFSIDDGRAWTNARRVIIGDKGWSPFFEPGVVVWDGGSIIGGYRASPGMDYPSQTLRLVPHPVRSRVSWSAAAVLSDMLADGPAQVDARYREHADADVCVVMGGGADLADGRATAMVHDDLVAYCLARQAAGFRVVVLTLLPRRESAGFERARQEFNGLVRANWQSYADGLADIAADGRIGDALDDLDQQYYQPDALHPNDAGYAVMATVSAPALNQLPWRSSACQIRLRNVGASWGDWRPYGARFSWLLTRGDGKRTVEIEYRDGSGATVAAADSIGVDTVRPVTKAPIGSVARRGRPAKLWYRVVDAEPCGPRARTVTIKVTNDAGTLVKRIRLYRQPVNETRSVSFTVPSAWRAGAYGFAVLATDNAGNPQVKVGRNKLTVR